MYKKLFIILLGLSLAIPVYATIGLKPSYPLNDFLIGNTTNLINSTSSPFFPTFSFGLATGTSATTTSFFSILGTFTNLFGTNISGFGLASCSGTSALTYSGTTFGCAVQPQGTVTSVSGTYPVLSTGGATPIISLAFGTTTDNIWGGQNTFLSSTTLQNFTAVNSTTTNATTTTSYTGSFYANGLVTCNSANSALLWSGGTFGCNTIAVGGGSKWASTTNGIVPNGGVTTRLGIGTSTDPAAMFDLYSNGTTMPLRVSSSTGFSYLETELNGLTGLGTGSALSPLHINYNATTSAASNIGSNLFGTSPVLRLGTTALTSPSTNGTFVGANALTTFNGDFQNYQKNGTSQWKVDNTGNTTQVGGQTAGGGGYVLDAGGRITTFGGTSSFVGANQFRMYLPGSSFLINNNGETANTSISLTASNGSAVCKSSCYISMNIDNTTDRFRLYDSFAGFGTTSPKFLLQLATGTAPQLTISDPSTLTNPHWSFRNYGGNLAIATSSPTTFATSSQSALVINTSGYLGIATTSPWRTLSVTGTIAVDGMTTAGSASNFPVCITPGKELVNAGNNTCTLSSRFTKHDIKNVTSAQATNAVLNLTPVTYTENASGQRLYGFIAEEVASIDPLLAEYATEDQTVNGHLFKKGDPLSVDYPRMVANIVKYLQDHASDTKQRVEESWQWYAIGGLGLLVLVLFGWVFTLQRAINRIHK